MYMHEIGYAMYKMVIHENTYKTMYHDPFHHFKAQRMNYYVQQNNKFNDISKMAPKIK